MAIIQKIRQAFKPVTKVLGFGLKPPTPSRRPLDDPAIWMHTYGHSNYQKLLLDPHVYAILHLLSSYVASCFRSASGRLPNKQELDALNASIAHLPPAAQDMIRAQIIAEYQEPQIKPPNNATPQEYEATLFIRDLIDYRIGRNRNDMLDDVGRNFKTVISQTLMGGWIDGTCYQEIDWMSEQNRVIANDILHWHPSAFSYDRNDRLTMKATKNWQGGIVPLNKFIVWRHDAAYEAKKGTPLLTKFVYPCYYKFNDIHAGHISLERFGAPTITGELDLSNLPSSYTPEAYITYWNEQILPNVHNGGCIAYGKGDAIKILESGRRSGFQDFEAAVKLQNREMSKAALGSALALEEGDSGSLALANATAAPALRAIVADYVGSMNELFSRTLISWAVAFNFPSDVRPPSLAMTLPEQTIPVAIPASPEAQPEEPTL